MQKQPGGGKAGREGGGRNREVLGRGAKKRRVQGREVQELLVLTLVFIAPRDYCPANCEFQKAQDIFIHNLHD